MSTHTERRHSLASASELNPIRDLAAETRDSVLRRAEQIAAIPSPTFEEHARSAFVAAAFEAEGLRSETDDIGDVVARIPGRDRSRSLLLAAHIDTVFPRSTRLEIRREGGRINGPGIGDNSLGVAACIALPSMLRALGAIPSVDLLLTGNVGEEGLGNLRGMRAIMDRHPDIGAVVAIEGHNLGRVTHVAVGSRRLRVRVNGPGGHSWGDFGNPNAIHGAAEIICELAKIPLPSTPKTTLNFGTIRGGISINTIAPQAEFDVDMRSIDEFALNRLWERAERIIRTARGRLTADFELIGDRPAGVVPPESRIVRHAVETLAALGIAPSGDASSTDANIPISRGIPAVCIGLTSGGNVHREDEYIEIAPVASGLAQLVALSLAVADDVAAGVAGT